MRKRVLSAVAVAAAAALCPASAAQAVTYGEVDEREHPYVGALLWDHDLTNPGIEGGCSGTLVSSTVFLTAAHCDPDFDVSKDRVLVSFDPDVDPVTSKTRLHAGRFIGHPNFTGRMTSRSWSSTNRSVGSRQPGCPRLDISIGTARTNTPSSGTA